MFLYEEGGELFLELFYLINGDVIEETIDTGIEGGDLFANGHRFVLELLEKFRETGATIELFLGFRIEIRSELGKDREFPVLGQFHTELAGDFLHRFPLRRGAHTGNGKSDVHRGADTFVEQIRFKVDLPAGDGNDIGWNVGRDIACLCFNDGERRERPSSVFLIQTHRTLQEPRVEVEDITGIRFASGRTPKQE